MPSGADVPPPMKSRPPTSASLPLAVDSVDGRYSLLGLPVWFISPEYYTDLEAHLETILGKAAKGILYRAAFAAGRRMARGLAAMIPVTGRGQDVALARMERIPEIALLAGHGKSEFTVVDLGKGETRWIMERSYIAEFHAPTREAVCHLYAGMLAGVLTDILGHPEECEEVECRAKGDPHCTFRTRAATATPI